MSNTHNNKTNREVERIDGVLHEITTITNEAGQIVHKMTAPMMVELRLHDVVQVVVGATILAIPVSFTEEVWRLGGQLSATRVAILALCSVSFTAIFVYYNFYRRHFRRHLPEFLKRVLVVYIISLLVCGGLLTLIMQAQWSVDWVAAIKRTVLVALPASLSAVVVDLIK